MSCNHTTWPLSIFCIKKIHRLGLGSNPQPWELKGRVKPTTPPSRHVIESVGWVVRAFLWLPPDGATVLFTPLERWMDACVNKVDGWEGEEEGVLLSSLSPFPTDRLLYAHSNEKGVAESSRRGRFKRLRLDDFEVLETKLPVRLINTTNEHSLVKGHGTRDNSTEG
ncbi:hypothetical protein TNCV_1800161 [Trichonephila clavipes]|nr:hypothetical protein TNCV_1800161 [Trichonephila clavipes]